MNQPQEITEAQFFEIVDSLISQANECSKRFPVGLVSDALMFAAARYNAFNWVNRSLQREQTPDEAAILFRAEYEKLFRDSVQNLGAARG